jgi:hypothetical protein
LKVVGKGRQTNAPWEPSDTVALAEVVHSASEAVTTLADRLNALALRVALMGGVADLFGRQVEVEAYLNRLSSLVTSAGDQMLRVQKLLYSLEASTFPADSKRQGSQVESVPLLDVRRHD